MEDELSRCKSLRVPTASTSALLCWKEQAIDYPVLATVARRLFRISASAAQSGRDFSSVGRTITDSRSQLHGCVQSRVNWASAMGTASWIDLVVLRCISYLLYSHSDCFYTFGPDSCSSLYYVTQTWLYENTRHVHFSRMNTSWMGWVGLADDTKWVGSGLN